MTFSGSLEKEQSLLTEFPALIGRHPDAAIRLVDPGIWERHAEIRLDPNSAFTLAALPPATVLLNGERIEISILKNGDVLEMGGVKIQFWLADIAQKSLFARETFIWLTLGALLILQTFLIRELSR